LQKRIIDLLALLALFLGAQGREDAEVAWQESHIQAN